MNNQITLTYLDYDDLDALQVVSVVSFMNRLSMAQIHLICKNIYRHN